MNEYLAERKKLYEQIGGIREDELTQKNPNNTFLESQIEPLNAFFDDLINAELDLEKTVFSEDDSHVL